MKPLVTCVMPTRDRPEWVVKAIACFRRQTYEPKELIVLDNGDQSVRHLVPGDLSIYYERTHPGQKIGSLRNRCGWLADGGIIAHWDDDDWHHPERLAVSVWCLEQGAEIVGTSHVYLRRLDLNRVWLSRKPDCPPWVAPIVCGPSLVYRRSFWESNPFPDVEQAEEMPFMGSAWQHKIADLRAPLLSVLHIRYDVDNARGRHLSSVQPDTLDNVLNSVDEAADAGRAIPFSPWADLRASLS